MHQLLLEPRPGTYAGWLGRETGGSAESRVGHVPVPDLSPRSGLFSPSQVRGASEEPTQFSLTNAAGTHTTSEGISSPTSGELVFSSFHNLLSGPYFWSLPSRFRGDKVGSGGRKRKGIPGLEARMSWCPWRKGGRRGWSSGMSGLWGLG